jgi:hypothetical protein
LAALAFARIHDPRNTGLDPDGIVAETEADHFKKCSGCGASAR